MCKFDFTFSFFSNFFQFFCQIVNRLNRIASKEDLILGLFSSGCTGQRCRGRWDRFNGVLFAV